MWFFESEIKCILTVTKKIKCPSIFLRLQILWNVEISFYHLIMHDGFKPDKRFHFYSEKIKNFLCFSVHFQLSVEELKKLYKKCLQIHPLIPTTQIIVKRHQMLLCMEIILHLKACQCHSLGMNNNNPFINHLHRHLFLHWLWWLNNRVRLFSLKDLINF